MKDKIIDDAIRKVPNFPKPGILFYDVTSILENPHAFSHCIKKMADTYTNTKIDCIAALEARGFLFAAPLAEKLNLPLILVRKAGKLPGETYSCSYELEYGTGTFEVLKSSVHPGKKVLLVDDLIATGGSLNAAVQMFKTGGAEVVECCGIIGLPFLNYEEKLNPIPVSTLINYSFE